MFLNCTGRSKYLILKFTFARLKDLCSIGSLELMYLFLLSCQNNNKTMAVFYKSYRQFQLITMAAIVMTLRLTEGVW